MTTITEPAQTLPVAGTYDVAVAGSGPAGFIAASIAAKENCAPRKVDVKKIPDALIARGVKP